MYRALAYLERVQSAIGFLNFVALTVIVALQILTRFVIQHPLLWSEELARFLLFFLIMNGAALAVSRNRHFTIEFINLAATENRVLQLLLQMIPFICIMISGLIMIYYGIQYAEIGGHRILPISGMNMMYVYAAIPISGMLIVIYSFCHAFMTVLSAIRK